MRKPSRRPGSGRKPYLKILAGAVLAIVCVGMAGSCARVADVDDKALAAELVRQSGIDRGVCALIGGTADLAVKLVASSDLLVHVRHPDAAAVVGVQAAANEAGYGIDRLVASRGGLDRLPYGSNVVDLLIAAGSTEDELGKLSLAEVLRVLRPDGVAIVGTARDSSRETAGALQSWSADAKEARAWQSAFGTFCLVRKPVPAGIDEWTHWEHGPDNNPVSTDQIIRAPYLTQFMAEPYYIGMPSITTAAGGRTFLAAGHIAHHEREWDMVNKLIARNGYNGTVLWTRDLPARFLSHRSAFVATPDIFYLLDGGGCLMLDAGTGVERGRIEIPGIEDQWQWMAMDGDILYVMAGAEGTDDNIVKGDRSFGGWSWADLSEGYYTQKVPWGFGRTLAAYDSKKGRLLWKHEEEAPIDARAMALMGDRIYLYCPEKHLRCLNSGSGEILWTNSDAEVGRLIDEPGRGLISTPGFKSSCLAVATPQALILQGQTQMNVVAVSAEDGSLLWTKRKTTNNPNVIYVDGRAILGIGARGTHLAVDPVSGQVLEDLAFPKLLCTRLTACPDSFFVRGEGTLRFDRASKKVLIDGAIRPGCNDGAIPANGLLYLGPWSCDCNLSLIGAVAKCSAGDFRFDHVATEAERLELGQGGVDVVAPFEISRRDWPTDRANNQRSASSEVRLTQLSAQGQDAPVPAWVHKPGRPYVPTPPICAGGMVFVGGSDGKVRALDMKQGNPAWEFATGGPIKAPPSLWEGRIFVGSGDGCVYALEAASGRLLWKFRAAPVERLIMIYGSLGSTWPVNTGILVQDGVAYFAAGIIDTDGTYVYALDAKTGRISWQNNTSGHLNVELRKGVSAQGNLTIYGGELLMAGGNQVSPARFDLKTGECLERTFDQGRPKAHHGRFVGVFLNQYPIAGGRALYASPRNVANKDNFRIIKDGLPVFLNIGGIPPAWNNEVVAMVHYRFGKLSCYDAAKADRRIRQGLAPGSSGGGDRRTYILSEAFDADGTARWKTDLEAASNFETVSLAVVPDGIAAVTKLQNHIRAHPQWQAVVLNGKDGAAIARWRQDLPGEPLPGGLAVGREGQLIVTLLDGSVISLAPKGSG